MDNTGAFAYEDSVAVVLGVRGKNLVVGTASGMDSSRSSEVVAAGPLLGPGKAIHGEVAVAVVAGLGHSLESREASIRRLFSDTDRPVMGSLLPRRR